MRFLLHETLAAAEPICFACYTANRPGCERPDLVLDRRRTKGDLLAPEGTAKALLLCLVLGLLPASGQEASLVPIALYTEFQSEPPPAVFDALQDEVNTIVAPSGLRFTWRTLRGAHGGDGSVELAVITFKGRCDVVGLTRHGINPGPLGWTYISGGVILPFAEVDCEGIRGFIQKKLITMPPGDREEAYGRALGRVLAHELYHIFAKTARHSSRGVGKSKFSVQDLLSTDFQFETRESLALKTGEAHAALDGVSFLSGTTGLSGKHFENGKKPW